jgi:GrpB-like predicted nucleotidyltransferase (UPF0157 family)
MSGTTRVGPTDSGLGLDKSEVRLLPHNPDWLALGELECAVVTALLGDLAVAVVHVGSTAVPALEAKPILDIVAAVGDRTPIDDVVTRLCADGTYTYDSDRRDDGGLLFVRGEGTLRTVHVHVVGRSSRAWLSYLQFHALLLEDAQARERYQTAKRDLARTFAWDRQGYTTAKSEVVEELLDSGPPPPHAR